MQLAAYSARMPALLKVPFACLQVSQNPFLSTLPGDGNGQTLVTLGPCSGNTVHTHPRGSEISFVTYGEIVSLDARASPS